MDEITIKLEIVAHEAMAQVVKKRGSHPEFAAWLRVEAEKRKALLKNG